MIERFLDDLDALALKHVRQARIIFEMDVIKRRNIDFLSFASVDAIYVGWNYGDSALNLR